MALSFYGNKNSKKKVVGQLRRTQLITTFGSGSIVDMPDYSVIIAATDYWSNLSPILHERNLEKLLHVSHFKQPYAQENEDSEYTPDVPAYRFPYMHFCPECNRLMPYWGFGDDNGKTHPQCKKNIVPSRFVAACVNGHIEDFPYRWWVHRGDFSECPDSKDGDLKITFSDKTGGLESIIITCTRCNKSRSMAGCLGRDALKGYRCRGKRPWIGMKAQYNDPDDCAAPMRGLQRGASNVYFSQTASALTIPPWSRQLNQEIDANWERLKPVFESNSTEETIRLVLKAVFMELINSGKYSLEDILGEVKTRLGNGTSDVEYTKQNLYEEEYRVFCLGNYDQPDDFQFKIEQAEVPKLLSEYIDAVVLAKRLREVMALRGFRRILPAQPNSEDSAFAGYHMEGDCIPLSNAPQDWCPGIEMLGEGIFIRLNEKALSEWEADNEDYYRPLRERLERSNVECENFSPRYVLLHTLSHLLIRQLSVECGYSGSAIKERIYSTYPDSENNMAGILLYTSSSDSDGSLGGLVRNGLPQMFEIIVRNALQEASWCSSDPVCIDSHAQGYDSLNYAACHACTLLPETSCEMRNCLLDRGAVVGSVEDRERGFFGKLL